MPKIKANNIHLYYESIGEGEPLVFITGFGADRTAWAGVVEDFAKEYRSIIFDNRGSGLSDVPDSPYSIEMMAEDVKALLSALQIKKCHLVGLSMGGAILQTFAWKNPQYCQTITLVNSFTKIDIRFALFAQARQELLKLGVSKEILSELVWGLVFSRRFLSIPENLEAIRKVIRENPPAMGEIGHKHQLSALLAFNSESWLEKISVPCLVIGSNEDAISSEDHMRNLATQIPDAIYHGFNGVGHIPQVEEPEKFTQVVKKFLSYHPLTT